MERDQMRAQLIGCMRHMLQSAEREARVRERLTQERLRGECGELSLGDRDRLELALASAGTNLDATIGEVVDQLIDLVTAQVNESAQTRAGIY